MSEDFVFDWKVHSLPLVRDRLRYGRVFFAEHCSSYILLWPAAKMQIVCRELHHFFSNHANSWITVKPDLMPASLIQQVASSKRDNRFDAQHPPSRTNNPFLEPPTIYGRPYHRPQRPTPTAHSGANSVYGSQDTWMRRAVVDQDLCNRKRKSAAAYLYEQETSNCNPDPRSVGFMWRRGGTGYDSKIGN